MEKMRISKEGIDLIKGFEGFMSKAYKPVCTERYFTIGYGHYGPDVRKGMEITEEEGERLFMEDVRPIEILLNDMEINFPQRCFDALVSWVYNLGAGNFNTSTLKKKIYLDAKDMEITAQMIRWVNAGGKPMLGLKKRRVAEANMFLGSDTYYIDKDYNIKTR